MIRKGIFLITLVILSACTPAPQPEPISTPEPPPPTEIPTPTPEPDYQEPVFVPIPDQLLIPGSEVIEIDLSDDVFYVDLDSDLVTWTAETSADLEITMDGPRMQIRRTSDGWLGNQNVRVEVCNPGDLCGHADFGINLIGLVENGIAHTQIDGVIIEVGGIKIMIDALFLSPSGTSEMMEELMRSAAAPYDGVDLILATHHHWDHFNAGIVVDHLINNPEAKFLSTDVAVQMMAREEDYDLVWDRVTGVHLENGESTILPISGVDLEIMFISHGNDEEMPNFGYLFTLGDHTFFHTGDIVADSVPVETLVGYGLPEKGIDYAFIPYFMLTARRFLPYTTEGINPQYVVPVHISTEEKLFGPSLDTIEENFENVVSFRRDYSWYSFP